MLYHMNTNLSISFLSAMFTFWLRSSNEPPSEALKTNNFASVALMLVSPLCHLLWIMSDTTKAVAFGDRYKKFNHKEQHWVQRKCLNA